MIFLLITTIIQLAHQLFHKKYYIFKTERYSQYTNSMFHIIKCYNCDLLLKDVNKIITIKKKQK